MHGVLVTGTDTGVGKTILSAALLAAMRAEGELVRAHKPVVTGLDEPSGDWPPDHELLALAADMDPEEVAPLRYGPAASPHLAAALTEQSIDRDVLISNARAATEGTPPAPDGETVPQKPGAGAGSRVTLIVEGVGGLFTPLTDDYTVRDLAVELGLPVLIATRPGLGTINHTLLTIEAARAAGLVVIAVVITPWPAAPSEMERSNLQTIARMGHIEVETLAHVAHPHVEPPGSRDLTELARAGALLPWRRWLAAGSAP